MRAAFQDLAHYMRAGTLQLSALPPLGLYVHLPWCIKKCPYCDFNSHAVTVDAMGGAAWLEQEQQYTAALMADLEAALPLVWGRPVISVFIGGGTPSLFSPAAIERLLGGIRARLPLMPECEITLEANPGTFEKDRFRAYRAAGVTRLSIGVQSFADEHLRVLGRVHDGAQAKAALSEAAACFDTFNLDLIYALPGQSRQQLQSDLQTALAFAPPHLSVYHLTMEPNTYFAKHPPAHLPDEDTAYTMLDDIVQTLATTGLARYEVSAYARADHRCVHNLNYWTFGDYLGIGAGAHSKLSFAHRVVRQIRRREPQAYVQQAMAGDAVVQETEVARQDLPFEFMMNALRLREGVSLNWFCERTGLPLGSIEKPLEKAQSLGLLEVLNEDEGEARRQAGFGLPQQRIRPSARGLDFLNDLQALFLP